MLYYSLEAGSADGSVDDASAASHQGAIQKIYLSFLNNA